MDESLLYPSRLLPFLNMHFKKIETLLLRFFIYRCNPSLFSNLLSLLRRRATIFHLLFLFWHDITPLYTPLSLSVSVSFSSPLVLPFLFFYVLPSFPSPNNVCHFLFLFQLIHVHLSFFIFFVGQFLFSFLESFFLLHGYVPRHICLFMVYNIC